MEAKYKTINQKRYLPDGRYLTRIVAKRDFGNVKKGDVGGFIEDTCNLSQSGHCWVAEKASVYGLARVSKDAVVRGYAVLKDRVIVTDHAVVEGRALLDQHVYVGGHAHVGNSTYLSGTATVVGNARLFCYGFRSQSGKTLMPNVRDLVRIKDFAFLEGRVSIRDNAVLGGKCKIIGRVRILQNAFVGDEAEIRGSVEISGNAHVIQFARVRDRSVITNNALVGGHSLICGRSLITGAACVIGQCFVENEIVSGDCYMTTRNGWLVTIPNSRISERSSHAVTPLSATSR